MTVPQLDETSIRRLVRLCAALAGSTAAEDLAQDTLVAALRSGAPPPSPEALDAWLAGIARNVARRHWRARGRELPAGPVHLQPSSPTGGTDDVVERREQLVQHALARLPEASRSLLSARLLGGQSTGALAAQLGLSPAAVSMRLTRAGTALRRVLTDELGEEARSAGIRLGRSGWRPTPLWCGDCGGRRLEMRRTDHHVAFRCPGCCPHPDGVGSEFRLANRTFGTVLRGIAQPAALARRAAAWSHDYFDRPGESGQAPCTACGRLARMLPYRRSAPALALRHRVGLHVTCDACGETVSTSLGGLIAARPEAAQLRARARRVRAVDAVPAQVDGRAAFVAGLQAVGGTASVELVVAADTLRVISVRTTS